MSVAAQGGYEVEKMIVEEVEAGHETLVRVAPKDEEVRIMFGGLVAWISLEPLKAIELSDKIKLAAEEVLRSDV